MPNYYLHRDGQNHGPYSFEQMNQLITSRQIAPEELICQEGGADWVPASSLRAASVPKMGPGVSPSPRTAASKIQTVTHEHVDAARQGWRTPFLGIVFSAALPLLLWAAKSDAKRGVRISGKHSALQALARDNVALLPIAIVIGIIGVVLCSIWLAKALKNSKLIKAEFKRQQGG